LHIPHKCAAKAGKKAIFRPENPNGALAAEKLGGEIEIGCIAAINTPELHSRHWPESSIKSSQANAGGEQANLPECNAQAIRKAWCATQCPACLQRLPT